MRLKGFKFIWHNRRASFNRVTSEILSHITYGIKELRGLRDRECNVNYYSYEKEVGILKLLADTNV